MILAAGFAGRSSWSTAAVSDTDSRFTHRCTVLGERPCLRRSAVRVSPDLTYASLGGRGCTHGFSNGRRVAVLGAHIKPRDHGVNLTADAAAPQFATYVDVSTSGGVVGLRFGGTPNAGNKVTATGCQAEGFASEAIASAGWNHTGTGNIP